MRDSSKHKLLTPRHSAVLSHREGNARQESRISSASKHRLSTLSMRLIRLRFKYHFICMEIFSKYNVIGVLCSLRNYLSLQVLIPHRNNTDTAARVDNNSDYFFDKFLFLLRCSTMMI